MSSLVVICIPSTSAIASEEIRQEAEGRRQKVQEVSNAPHRGYNHSQKLPNLYQLALHQLSYS